MSRRRLQPAQHTVQRDGRRAGSKPSCACARVDHAALRKVLGGRPDVVEVLEAGAKKGSGRPGVNASVLWAYFTQSVYSSGDLPVLATREMAQNSSLCGAPHNEEF